MPLLTSRPGLRIQLSPIIPAFLWRKRREMDARWTGVEGLSVVRFHRILKLLFSTRHEPTISTSKSLTPRKETVCKPRAEHRNHLVLCLEAQYRSATGSQLPL